MTELKAASLPPPYCPTCGHFVVPCACAIPCDCCESGVANEPRDWEALWDPDNLWWAVGSPTHGCFDNGLGEAEARVLAAALNAPYVQEEE